MVSPKIKNGLVKSREEHSKTFVLRARKVDKVRDKLRGWRIYKVVGSVKRETGLSFVGLGYPLACCWWPGSATRLFDPAERGHDGIF